MKHIFLAIITVALVCQNLMAQNVAVPFKNEKDKWGLKGVDDNVIVKPRYSDMEALADGNFKVAEGGKVKDGILEGEKWGVIDASGAVVLKADYDEIGDFVYGLASITKGGKTGFINCDYTVIAAPKYDYVGTINSKGLVWVNTGGKPDKNKSGYITNGKFGVINSTGNFVVPVAYKSVGYVVEPKYSYDEMKILAAKSETERLMLECGSQNALWPKQIELKPGSIIPADVLGLAFSKKDNLLRNGIADLNGNVLVKEDLYQRCAMPTDGLALVLSKKNQTGFHDLATGKLDTRTAIKSAFSFQGNKTIGIDTKNKWTFYDRFLSPIGEPYDWISPMIKSRYLVIRGGKMALLDAATLTPIVSDMRYIFPEKQGFMAFMDDESGLWGFLDEQGEVALPAKYESAHSFYNGVAFVKDANHWGAISTNLEEVIPAKFSGFIIPSTEEYDKIWVRMDLPDKQYRCWHLGNRDFAFDESYDDVANYEWIGNEELAMVKKGNKIGHIDGSGQVVIPLEHDNYNLAKEALDYKHSRGINVWQKIHSYRFNTIQKNRSKTFKLKDTLPTENWDY